MDEKRLRVIVASPEETAKFGRRFAAALPTSMVIGLVGELGAGKTTFVRSVAVALGAKPEDVSSPTFTLIQEYTSTPPVCHVDAYRLSHPDEFGDLGLEEAFESAIVFVEWADRVADWLPEERLTLTVEVTGVDSRTFTLSASGSDADAVLNLLRVGE